MNCRGVSRRLSAYIDGDISPGMKEVLDAHLGCCASCKRRLNEVRAIVEAGHSLEPLRVSEGFTERVLEAVSSNRETKEVLGAARYRLTLAGVAFMVAAGAVFFLVGPPSPDGISPATTQPQHTEAGSANPPATLDFYSNPGIIVQSFPVPGEIEKSNPSTAARVRPSDSLILADSSSKIEEFILPELDRSRRNVNLKF